MKKMYLVSIFAVLALFAVLTACGGDGKNEGIVKKSAELTSSLGTRAEKVDRIFSFVRDEIAETKTQYG